MSGETILIVEDEKTIVNNLSEKFQAEGYNVSVAMDGETGWDKVRSEKPDLVLLDIMLPELDGVSLCRMIRQEDSIKRTPIIMLTARATEMDKIVTLESGADDYITKPFNLGELLAKIRAMLRLIKRERATVQAKELASGDLVMNLTEHRVYKADDELKLSNKEFALLAELMRNKNAVLSRDLILTKVWGYDHFVDKRTVDVHIRWLREKIEDEPSNPRYIRTVRGIGYSFQDPK